MNAATLGIEDDNEVVASTGAIIFQIVLFSCMILRCFYHCGRIAIRMYKEETETIELTARTVATDIDIDAEYGDIDDNDDGDDEYEEYESAEFMNASNARRNSSSNSNSNSNSNRVSQQR